MTHPFDNAMIAVRAHVELGQFKKAQTSATRARALAPKPAGPPHPKSPRTARPGQTAAGHVSTAPRVDLSTERNERITATRLLRQIQAGLTVKISGGLDIAPSSNINKISYSTTHTSINPLTGALQTIPWTANEPERNGYGLLLWSGLSYALPKTKLGTQLASLNLSTDIYNEPRFNRISLNINHGLVLTPAAQHHTSFDANLHCRQPIQRPRIAYIFFELVTSLCSSRSPKSPTNCPARLVPWRRYNHPPTWQRQPGAKNQLAPPLARQLIKSI